MSRDILRDDAIDDLGATPPPPAEPARKRRGCLLYGCGTAVVLLIFAAVGVWWFVTGAVESYTDVEPRPLPVVTLAPERVEQLEERASEFEEAMETPEPEEEAPSLVLSEEEVNTLLLRENPGLRGKLLVRLEGDKLAAELSLPLDFLGLKMFKKRYLNGRAVVDASVQNGKVHAMIEEIRVNGRPLPRAIERALREKDLGENLHFEPETQKYIDRIKSLEVEDSQLIIRARPRRNPEPKTEPPAEEKEALEQP